MWPIEDALAILATTDIEVRSAIFTRHEVAEFILDFLSYTPEACELLAPQTPEPDESAAVDEEYPRGAA